MVQHRLLKALGLSGLTGLTAVAVWKRFGTVEADAPKSTIPITQVTVPIKSAPNPIRRSISEAVQECQSLVERHRSYKNVPGLVIGVSIGGKRVWTEGFGFANLEQSAKCSDRTLMRIASISKPITMMLVAQLVEEGKLDLDKPVSHYLTEQEFPKKQVDGKTVDITLRQLVSHLGGIRHYKVPPKPDGNNGAPKSDPNRPFTPNETQVGEFGSEEYYLRVQYPNVIESLKMFKDDPLAHEPGTKYLYTTFGWTLISACIEKVLPQGQNFGDYLVTELCRKKLGMWSTYLDKNEPIIFDRTNYYIRSKKNPSIVINAPEVDNSYKWAGGGLLSSIPDLLLFGNVMMYSFLGRPDTLLKKDTMDKLWTPIELTKRDSRQRFGNWSMYGQGWVVIRDAVPDVAGGMGPPLDQKLVAYHSGGAVGATSFLLILPGLEMVVACFNNLQNSGVADLCLGVAEVFSNVDLQND